MAYDLCGIEPSRLREITPKDLKVMLTAALTRRKREGNEEDVRLSRVAAWVTASITGQEIPFEMFMPGYVPKEVKPRGLTPDEIRAKFKAHNISIGAENAS